MRYNLEGVGRGDSGRRSFAHLAALAAAAAGLACATAGELWPAPTAAGDPGRQATVDALRELTADLDFPDHFQQENPARTGDEFDANRYFDVLEHLSMAPGYTLDYVYRFDGLGGAPVLYARQAGAAPLETLADYTAAAPEPYLRYVQTDGSEEGFYQLGLLSVMGGQFYLYWHAGYFDDEVVADGARLQTVLDETQEWCGEMEAGNLRRARTLDVRPVVEMAEGEVSVSFVVFTKWGGFTQRAYRFARAFPHEALQVSEEVLVEYQCNVVF